MNDKPISLDKYKREKNELLLDTKFNRLIPLILEERKEQIEIMAVRIRKNSTLLDTVLQEHNLSETNFYLLPENKLNKYLKIETENMMLKSTIVRFAKQLIKKTTYGEIA